MLHEISAGAGGCFGNQSNAVRKALIRKEMKNEDPQKALDDDPINFYKGVPVITTSLTDDSAFSFGVIIMGNKIEDPNLLNHEYGHIMQLKEIGVLGYVQYVVIPSVVCYWATEANILPNNFYYNLPWENIADRYGGAQREYFDGASDLADCYWFISKAISGILY